MKLWLLRPSKEVENLPCGPYGWEDDVSNIGKYDPWDPWYDKCFGFIVRAETEEDARKWAAARAADELGFSWLEPSLSSCTVLLEDGPVGIIMSDVHGA